MDPLRAASLTCLLTLSACFELPQADLEGPTIVAASLVGPRSVEVSVLPELRVEFSEPIDPATIHPGSVALIAWDELESCALTPVCAEGSCERGTCQRSPLTTTQRRALDRGELEGGEELELELGDGPGGERTVLTIRPRRPLAGHRRHSLIVGAAVRDRSGAPLVDEWGRIGAWQRDFVTARRGSAGPEPRLVAPSHGQAEVPTNVAAIATEFWPPIPLTQPGASLLLEAQESGQAIELGDPIACPGWAPGTCLSWRPSEPLLAGARYRPAGGTVIDRHGRAAVLPAAVNETWFAVGDGPDLDPPSPTATAQMRGRCLAVWLDVGEPVDARLRVGAAEQRAAIASAGWIGLAIADELDPEQLVAWSIELTDLADNHATLDGELPAGPGFDASLPRLGLTEILANPDGPEPDAEFVELRAGPDGASLEGLHLADASLAQIRDAWAMGEVLGDPLPAVELEPDEVAIVVGSGFGAEPSEDPPPVAGTRVLIVDASLGDGGLKNAGERVTVWAQTEHGPAAIAGYGDWIDTSAASHEGRSVVAGSDGCDLPDRWRSHPFGRSTPGTLP